jgi:hypothetical protein
MHHLFLLSSEVVGSTPGHDVYQPQGAIVTAFSRRMIRKQWVDLICDILSPMERQGAAKKFPSKRSLNVAGLSANLGWGPDRIRAALDIWSGELWIKWAGLQSISGTEKEEAYQELWDKDLASQQGWVDAMGMDAGGVISVTETLPISFADKKTFVHVLLEDGLNADVEVLANKDELIVDGQRVMIARHKVNYRALGWSAQKIIDAEDQTKATEPDYSQPARVNNVLQVVVPPRALRLSFEH